MPLRLYNSMSRRLETFEPLQAPDVSFYKCGMTVYGPAHLGHAKSAIAFDVMVRWLRLSGYNVRYLQNITDVGHLTDDGDDGEDKIVKEARRRGLHPMAIVETFMRSWLDDMDSLHMLRPDIMPRAAGHIPEQIELIETLVRKGHAYVVDGSVYFDVSTFPNYGKLSGRTVDEQEAGARVEVRGEKRRPADFALWKRAAPDHIMQWKSPWGLGFPGWHAECSAMAMLYLGETIDIHGGGLDNQFPHHECEIAQSESATGKPFVRYWLHNNMCTINGQKMAKSLGNGVTIRDILTTDRPLLDREGRLLVERRFDAAVVRHFILTSHYRQTQDFSNESLLAAESGNHKLRDIARELAAAARGSAGIARGEAGIVPAALPRAAAPAIQTAIDDLARSYTAAMDDDFNTASALAALFEFSRHARAWLNDGVGREDAAAAAAAFTRYASDGLGLYWCGSNGGAASSKQDDLIRMFTEMRQEARKSKNFALSDQIRDRLLALGVELRDGPQGTTWSVR